VLLFDIAELQDIKFPKSKDVKVEKAVKVDKGMIFFLLFSVFI